jgi:transposase
MEYIQGIDREQIVLFPDRLDEHVSEGNPVRVIDAYINSLDMKALGFSKAQPNDLGRPMYSPYDMLKLYLYGYMNRLRSSRSLETESRRNVELMWLLKRLTPDHKTISRFRRDNRSAMKNVFRDFVKLCMRLNLYGKELVAIDGSKFRAVNSKDNNYTDEKLKNLISRIDVNLEKYMAELCQNDQKDQEDSTPSISQIREIINGLKQRKQQYQDMAAELKATGESQKSTIDGDSRRMINNGKFEICYNVQTGVDDKHCLIADFEVTNEANDKKQLSSMAKKVKEMLESDRLTVVADKGYDSATEINMCLDNAITPHVAGLEEGIQFCVQSTDTDLPKTHSKGRCVYFPDRNVAVCPMGKILYPSFYHKRKRVTRFVNSKSCAACTQKCTSEKRKTFELAMKPGEFSKSYNDKELHVRQITYCCDSKIVKKRKSIVEHPFGTIKRNFSADYCLTKGLESVKCEFSLSFLALNMKRAINILGAMELIHATSRG